MNRPIVLGITGASGAPYAVRLLEVLLGAGRDVHLSISTAGAAVLKQELGLEVDLNNFEVAALLPPEESLPDDSPLHRYRVRVAGHETAPIAGLVHYHHQFDLMAPIASGSFLTAGMVICPCSGGTLSAVAHAASGNLIQRAADVHLKERRKLIVVPRETPLSLVQIDNLRRASEAGAIVLPASPGFYHGADSLADLVDFVVARICDQLDVEHRLTRRWGE
ncbi:MAG: UbiX family flavin prenyltransferase [Pirellulales bacterium]|nr:UbiX family flavin prenyltransferase [Pirellulales bacterium]